MSDLLPCPFCGGGETRISENRHSPTMSGNGGLISVEITHWCPAVPGQPSRNTVTRTGRDHASAIAAWNRRAGENETRAELSECTTELKAYTQDLIAIAATARRQGKTVFALRAEVARLREALATIAEQRSGLDLNATRREQTEYWSRLALWYRDTARSALSHATPASAEDGE